MCHSQGYGEYSMHELLVFCVVDYLEICLLRSYTGKEKIILDLLCGWLEKKSKEEAASKTLSLEN